MIKNLNASKNEPGVVESVTWLACYGQNGTDTEEQVEVSLKIKTTFAKADKDSLAFIPYEKIKYQTILDWIDESEPENYKDALIEKLTPVLEEAIAEQAIAKANLEAISKANKLPWEQENMEIRIATLENS
jgi:hypothetical protein